MDAGTIKSNLIDFLREEVNPGSSQRDTDQVFSLPLWKQLGSLGLYGICIGPEHGGHGFDLITGMSIFETFAHHCEDHGLTFSVAAQLFSCIMPLHKYGTPEQKGKYLPLLVQGEMIAAHAISESSSGSDAFNMKSHADWLDGSYILNAEKKYCTSGIIADLLFLYAITDPSKGPIGSSSVFILEKNKSQFDPGHLQDKLGLRTAQMCDIHVRHMAVAPDQLLGGIGGGFALFQYAMSWERMGMSIMHLAIMDRLIDKTIKYLKERKSGMIPLGQYQSIMHLLAGICTELEATRQLCYHTIREFQSGKQVYHLASMTKLKSSELFKSVATDLLHLQGAGGILTPNEYERTMRDAAASSIYSGTSEVQKNIIASYLKLN